MSILACPKCHEPLEIEGKTCKCINNHCYDIARQGYMNLLLNPDKASNNPGDSKESLIARKAYLDKGYYDPILFEVVNEIKKKEETVNDKALIKRCQRGDRQAFDELIRLFLVMRIRIVV